MLTDSSLEHTTRDDRQRNRTFHDFDSAFRFVLVERVAISVICAEEVFVILTKTNLYLR
jgi:hypothetical protein